MEFPTIFQTAAFSNNMNSDSKNLFSNKDEKFIKLLMVLMSLLMILISTSVTTGLLSDIYFALECLLLLIGYYSIVYYIHKKLKRIKNFMSAQEKPDSSKYNKYKTSALTALELLKYLRGKFLLILLFCNTLAIMFSEMYNRL